jgi:hypothetical protein
VESATNTSLPSPSHLPAATERKKNGRLSDTQQNIKQRREAVFHFLLRGLTQQEIAAALNVSQATVSYDVQFIESESVKSLGEVLEKTLPWQYEKTMRIVEEAGREVWIIYQNTSDDNIRLKALREIRQSAESAYGLLRNGQGLLQMQGLQEQMDQMREQFETWKRAQRRGWWMPPDDEDEEGRQQQVSSS